MTAFTRVGSTLWDWQPWTDLDERARLFWLALYTTAEARRNIVGLWHGGIPTMADAARMQPDAVREALDTLLERELVEYDPRVRVLRLCVLPDAGEYPCNGHVIRSWWTRFNSVPECNVRNAHVKTLQWIMEEGARRAAERKGQGVKDASPHHLEAWNATFATIVIPASRRRGVRRLAENDTSTHAQPSLFGDQAKNAPELNGSGNGYPNRSMQISSTGSSAAVDNSASLRQSNEINSPETVTDTVSVTNRIQDLGSRIPDLRSSGERGMGGGHDSGNRPTLTLVPPYTADEVMQVMRRGLWDQQFDKSLQDALGAMIPVWAAERVTLDDFRVLADYSAHSRAVRSARWILGCDLMAEIRIARQVLDWRDVRASAVADSL